MKDKPYTPTVERLRTQYEYGGATRQDPREFDRAIAKLQIDAINDHINRQALPSVKVEFTNQPMFEQAIRNAQADALETVAKKMRDRFTASWIRGEAYKIRNHKTTEETLNE